MNEFLTMQVLPFFDYIENANNFGRIHTNNKCHFILFNISYSTGED